MYIFSTSKKETKDELKNINYIYVKEYFKNIKDFDHIITKCDYFFHCSYQNDEKFAEENSIKDYKINIFSLENILNAIKKKNINFIFLSTVSLYASNKNLINENSKIAFLSNYNLHKYFCEKKIEYFVERSLSNFIILRISNIYGDNDINKRDFLLNIVHKILKNKKITIFGSGKYHRDYLHLEDVNSAISAIIKKKITRKYEIYNLCSGNSMLIINLVNKINLFINKQRNKRYNLNISFIKNK